MWFVVRPSVEVHFDENLNPYDPYAASFIIENNSNFSITNIIYDFSDILHSDFVTIRNNRIERVMTSDPNYQDGIQEIKAHNYATLNKTGYSFDLPLSSINYAELIIYYSYDYFVFTSKDSVLFKTQKKNNGQYVWSKYSFSN